MQNIPLSAFVIVAVLTLCACCGFERKVGTDYASIPPQMFYGD